MSRFCENCGKRIDPTHAYCEECGTPVAGTKVPNENEALAGGEMPWGLFANERQHDRIKDAVAASQSASVCGLILTSDARLQELTQSEYALLRHSLAAHLRVLRTHGICYHVLDLGDNCLGDAPSQDWKSCVDTLAAAVRFHEEQTRVPIRGVLLLGGNDVVPMPVFPNLAGDPDKDIDTDLPYSTLSRADPWKEGLPCLRPRLAVGRLPFPSADALATIAHYFQNVCKALASPAVEGRPFGLSAKQWTKASNEVFGDLFALPVATSPDVSLVNVAACFPREATFHYFNLHGASEEPYWYGQDGSSYPPAFAPAVIRGATSLNVIGVEACYGARFIDLPATESVLHSALGANTVAFAGASRIAFGPAAPPIGLADVVIHRFLREMKRGTPAGDALTAGRNAIIDDPQLDPAGIKTIIEFNLFGDPLLAPRSPEKVFLGKDDPVPSGPMPAGNASVVMPDVLGLSRSEVDSTRRRIRAIIDAYVYQRYPVLTGTQPDLAKLTLGPTRQEFTRWVYHRPQNPVSTTVMIYTDENGRMAKEFVSK